MKIGQIKTEESNYENIKFECKYRNAQKDKRMDIAMYCHEMRKRITLVYAHHPVKRFSKQDRPSMDLLLRPTLIGIENALCFYKLLDHLRF